MSAMLGNQGQTWFAPRDAPLEDDPQALRNALWLLTDEKYKEALASWFRMRSRDVYRAEEPERAPSFTREPPQRRVDPPAPFEFDRARWRAAVRDLSALSRGHPAILEFAVKVTADHQARWFTSSEGSALVTEEVLYGFHFQALARAEDGQLLENGRDFYARSESGLPPLAELRAAAAKVLDEIEALRRAPVLDPYTGPAILAPEATGVLFHEAVGHRLEGDRQDDDQDGQTFRGQVGRTVLPSVISVLDDPTVAAHRGVPLIGHYRFDDQGVPAQPALLVEDGVLKGFLLSRKPVVPFTRSNGHGRSQGPQPPVARMANLIVTSKQPVPVDELKRKLIAEAKRQGKPFGLIIREITGGDTNTTSMGYQAFRGTPRLVWRVDVATGREELVRGVELVGTPLASVNRVLATADDARAFNGFCGAESGYVPVSTVAPSALVSELELQRVARANERSPILPAPWNETVVKGKPPP
jgi:predicted Zn-dependent protease